VMGREELIAAFTPERILKKSSVFDLEKLSWLNGRHLAVAETARLVDMVRARLGPLEGAAADRLADDAWMERLLGLLKVRARSVDEVAAQAKPFLEDALAYDEDAVAKHWAKDVLAAAARLEAVAHSLRAAEWSEAALEEALRRRAEEMGMGAGKLIHPLRVALVGQANSPGIFEVLVLLGRDRSLERVEAALRRVHAMHESLS
jgi:glutamyl/glutaminyl-tRNA synthetase